MTADINKPGIAVICNAWAELDQSIHHNSFQCTLKCIQNHAGISAVLLAATHVELTADNQGVNQWYSNSRDIFVEKQGVDWIRRLWFRSQHDNNFNFAQFHHNPYIKNADYQGRPCIAVWEQWQLEWLLNRYFVDVENVWYFGAGLGVRRDPVGWAQLCDLIKYQHVRPINILTHKLGMLNNRCSNTDVTKSDFEYIDWQEVNWIDVTDEVVCKVGLEW